jgi:hypothetical protein
MPQGAYCRSTRLVAREIEGELILVPLTSGVGDLEDELYAFNETGALVWRKFDGRRTVDEIALELARESDAPMERIREDVEGLAQELLSRGLLVTAG